MNAGVSTTPCAVRMRPLRRRAVARVDLEAEPARVVSHRLGLGRRRRERLGVLAVPVDRALETLLQVDRRLPAEAVADLRRVDVLTVDLPVRVAGAADVGLDPRVREAGDRRHDVADPVRAAASRVEGLAPDLGPVEVVGERQVGAGGVLDVEEVALGRAVRAQHRPPALDRRADGLRDQAGEVEVAAAVDVREPRDGDREPVAVPVAARDQVGRRLRRLVGRGRLEREVLPVGQLVVRAVGLVGGGDDHPSTRRSRGTPGAESTFRARSTRSPGRATPAR